MSKTLSLVLAACLLAFPFATYAADYGSQPPQTQQSPPVAQPLVREGDFAMKLAAELDLGNPSDEASAEQMLAQAGIAPAEGWISDYPVTPSILAQLNDSLMSASSEGKLSVSKERAQQAATDVAQQMDLPLPAEGGAQGATTPQSANAVSNYYASEGPPVITYYAPPAGYAYLYDWVPFPAVWFGFTFPGFFIRHHFRTTVVVSPFFHHPHHRAIVTDRFFDHGHGPFFADHHGFHADHHEFHSGAMRSQMMHAHGRTFGSMGQSRGFSPGSFGGPMHSGRAAGGFGHGMGRGR